MLWLIVNCFFISRHIYGYWPKWFRSMGFMRPYFFEEWLLIKISWSGDVVVFSSIVICGSATIKFSKNNWLFYELIPLHIKVCPTLIIGLIVVTTGKYPCPGWIGPLSICIIFSSREYFLCDITLLVSELYYAYGLKWIVFPTIVHKSYIAIAENM